MGKWKNKGKNCKNIVTENNYPDIQANVHLNIHRQQWRWFDVKIASKINVNNITRFLPSSRKEDI